MQGINSCKRVTETLNKKEISCLKKNERLMILQRIMSERYDGNKKGSAQSGLQKAGSRVENDHCQNIH